MALQKVETVTGKFGKNSKNSFASGRKKNS